MTLPSAYTRLRNRFVRDESGSVLVLFGVSVGLLVAAGGVGLDLGQRQITQARVQVAADAASIAAATARQESGAVTTEDRERAALTYFNLNWPQHAGAAPEPAISVTSREIKVAAATTSSTAFVGTGSLAAGGSSTIKLSTALPPDYDLVIVVDETRTMGESLSNTNEAHPGANTRLGVIQSSILSLLDGILPPRSNNPNVRFGLTGASGPGYITTKLPMTSSPEDARTYPGYLRVHDFPADRQGGLIPAGTMVMGGNELIFDPEDPTPYHDYACESASFTVRGGAPGRCTATKIFVGEGFGCTVECTGISDTRVSPDYYSYAKAPSFWYQPKTATRRTNPSFSPCSRPGMTCPGRSPTRIVVAFPAGPIDESACRFMRTPGVILGAQAVATLYIINVGLTDPATVENLKECASKDPATNEPLYFEAPDERALRTTFSNLEETLNSTHISE